MSSSSISATSRSASADGPWMIMELLCGSWVTSQLSCPGLRAPDAPAFCAELSVAPVGVISRAVSPGLGVCLSAAFASVPAALPQTLLSVP